MRWLVERWRKSQYQIGYDDAVAQLRSASANPKIREVTMSRADGDGPRAKGWNDAMRDLTLAHLKGLADYD